VQLLRTQADLTSQPMIVVEDVVRANHPLRHDPDKLAAVLWRVYAEQRHTRPVNGAVRAAS